MQIFIKFKLMFYRDKQKAGLLMHYKLKSTFSCEIINFTLCVFTEKVNISSPSITKQKKCGFKNKCVRINALA